MNAQSALLTVLRAEKTFFLFRVGGFCDQEKKLLAFFFLSKGLKQQEKKSLTMS